MIYNKKEILVLLQRLGNKYDLAISEFEKANIYPFIYSYMHYAIYKLGLYNDKDLLDLVDIYKVPMKHLYDVVSQEYCQKVLNKVSDYEAIKKDIEDIKSLINKLSKEIKKNESVLTN